MASNEFERLLLDQGEFPVLALGMNKLGRILEAGRLREKMQVELNELESDLAFMLRDHRLTEQLKAPEGRCMVFTLYAQDAPLRPFVLVKKGQKFEQQKLDSPAGVNFRFIADSIRIDSFEQGSRYEPSYNIYAVSADGNRMLRIPNEGWGSREYSLRFEAIDAIPPEVIAEAEAFFSPGSPA